MTANPAIRPVARRLETRIPVTGGVELAVRRLDPDPANPGAADPAPADPKVANPGAADPGAADPDIGGVAVLLVHGLASNARTWDGVAEALAARGHQVAAVDQRGHGRSDKPDDGYDFATLSADLVAVIDALGWGERPPLVAGQSWGGNVVLELALRHPEATRAIACVDGGTIELARRFPSWERALVALMPPPLAGLSLSELETMIRIGHPDWSDEGVAGTLANMEVRADGTIAPWLSLDHHLTILRHLWEHRPSQRYPHLRVPVLMVPSAMALDDIAANKAGLPLVRVRRFDGADHDVHVQHPVELADLLHRATETAFLA